MMLTLVLASLVAMATAQAPGIGRCPNVPTQAVFDITKYMGVWYEIVKIPTIYQPADSICTQAEYTLRDDGLVKVVNQGYRTSIEEVTLFEGEATCPDAENPAKCGVRFFEDQPFGPYWVVETDYETYTLIFSCRNAGPVHAQSSWILARERSLDAATMKRLVDLAASYGIKTDYYDATIQTDCPAPQLF